MKPDVQSLESLLSIRKNLDDPESASVSLDQIKELLEYTKELEDRIKITTDDLTRLRLVIDNIFNAQKRAMEAWRHGTGNDDVYPDHAELVQWLLSQNEVLTRERDQARRYGSAAHTLNIICEALDLGGVSASRLAEMLGQPMVEMRTAGIQRVANALFDACHAEVYADQLEEAKAQISQLNNKTSV